MADAFIRDDTIYVPDPNAESDNIPLLDYWEYHHLTK